MRMKTKKIGRNFLSSFLSVAMIMSYMPTNLVLADDPEPVYVCEVNGVGQTTWPAEITSDATVKLLQDISGSFTIGGEAKNVTLDLNGHKLTEATDAALKINTSGVDLTITGTGTIETTGNKMAILRLTKPNCTFDVGENVTLIGYYGFNLMYNETSNPILDGSSTTVNMHGTIISKEYGLYVSGNLQDEAKKCIMNFDGRIYSESTAIYGAGYGVWNVSGTAEGAKTGIEIRAGELNVTSTAIITSTADDYVVNANSGGTTSEGVGIAVVQHTTQQAIKVNIEGGNISGPVALFEANVQGNGPDAIGKVSIDVTGGNFEGTSQNSNDTVLVSDVTNFVRGGSFNDSIPTNYIAEGCALEQDAQTGTYGIVVEKVAKIGDTLYPTILDAVDAAQPGDTIKMINNTEVSEPIIISKDLTIDGNGHEIDCKATRGIRIDTNGVDLELYNLSMKTSNNKCERVVQIEPNITGATIKIDGCDLGFVKYYAVNLCSNTSYTVDITNSRIEGWAAINAYGEGIINVSDSELVGTCIWGYNPTNNFAVVVVNNDGITVNLEDTIVTGDSNESGNIMGGLIVPADSKVNVEGDCEFTYDGPYLGINTPTDSVDIYNGTFSSDPSEYTVKGYTGAPNNDGTFGVVAGVAKIDNDVYDSLAEAVEAAQAGDTIIMVGDEELDAAQTIDKEVTIDLNGCTISGKNISRVIDITTAGDLTIEDSDGAGKITIPQTTISERSETIGNHGSLTVNGGTIENNDAWEGGGSYAIRCERYEGNTTTTTPGDSVTIIDGNILCPGGYGAVIFQGDSFEMIGGSIDSAYGIANNGVLGEPTTMTISGGSITSENDTAIYHPGLGTLNISGDAIITGGTGIEIRAGELNMTGGTVTATATPTSVTPNGNGSTTTGAGIAIAQHTTKDYITVNISGGNISGFSALYESNPQNNTLEETERIAIDITGGTFDATNGGTVTVYSQDKENFIRGGSFDSIVDERLCADNYIPVTEVDNNGYYTVTVDENAGYQVVDLYKGDKSQEDWTCPTESGKIFAGWYTDDTCTTPYTGTTGAAYPKFVDESVLAPRVQIKFGATQDTIRAVSNIDKYDYQEAGFYVNTPTAEQRFRVTKVYSSIVGSGRVQYPTEYSEEASAFIIVNFLIPQAGVEMTLTPYWITADGTLVKGGTTPTITSELLNSLR